MQESTITNIINIAGIAIDLLGVGVILVGIAAATGRFLNPQDPQGRALGRFQSYKIRLGQSLLLGLEILVAGDIIRTVALGLNFASLGPLGLLVLIRTFLSWTLILEVEGRWPWQPPRAKPQIMPQDADAREIRTNRSE